MAIAASDMLKVLSVTTGSAGNSTAQGNPNNSLGKYISTTAITNASANNLFDDISATENAAGTVDYRCFFVLNNHATLTASSVVVWIQTVSTGATLALSVDTTGVTAKGSSSAQAKTIANETSAPASQTFSSPTTQGAGLSIGSLAPGQCCAVWVRRTAVNGAAVSPAPVIRVSFVSPP